MGAAQKGRANTDDLCSRQGRETGSIHLLMTTFMTREKIHKILDSTCRERPALVYELLTSIKAEVAHGLLRRAQLHRRDPRQEVDDFSHEILLFLLAENGRVLRLWDPVRGLSLERFVRMISRQRVSRILRGHRSNPWNDEPMNQWALEPLLEHDTSYRILELRQELRALLEHVRGHLSERGVQMFRRIYVEQRSIAEVATEFKMTRQAVDAWNTRTRNLVRRLRGCPGASCARQGHFRGSLRVGHASQTAEALARASNCPPP